MSESVAIIGSGSWGTTLAVLLAERGIDTRLWVHRAADAERMIADRENVRFLPGIEFPADLSVTADAAQAIAGAGIVLIVMPMRSLVENLLRIAALLPKQVVLVSGVKGLDIHAGKRVSQIVEETLGKQAVRGFATMSGPNLAIEIAAKEPATTVIASSDGQVAQRIQQIFTTPRFRSYTSSDVVGVELAGALKNIIALGAGMSDGLGFGNNAKASLMTRGLAEITRLGLGGGRRSTDFRRPCGNRRLGRYVRQ